MFTPQDCQEDAAWEAQCEACPELSKDEMKQFMVLAPSDTHQYDYAGSVHSGIMTRYRKDDSKTCSLSQSMAMQDVAPPAPTPALESVLFFSEKSSILLIPKLVYNKIFSLQFHFFVSKQYHNIKESQQDVQRTITSTSNK